MARVGGHVAKLAVLIAAESTRPAIVEGLFAEIARYGTAHVKRAYGDWIDPRLERWKEPLLAQSIQPVQQFRYASGDSVTDGAMIIDAMDLLHSGRFDGFCIVSSGGEYARLASRVRESGLTVHGFGARETPRHLMAACDTFTYTDDVPTDHRDAGDHVDLEPEPDLNQDLAPADPSPRTGRHRAPEAITGRRRAG